MAVSKSLHALLFGKPAGPITIHVHCPATVSLSVSELASEIARKIADEQARRARR